VEFASPVGLNHFGVFYSPFRDIQRVIQRQMRHHTAYLIRHDGTLYIYILKKTNMTQQAEGVGNRKFVLEHDVYDIIVNTHFPLPQCGTFKAINERYYYCEGGGIVCLPCYSNKILSSKGLLLVVMGLIREIFGIYVL